MVALAVPAPPTLEALAWRAPVRDLGRGAPCPAGKTWLVWCQSSDTGGWGRCPPRAHPFHAHACNRTFLPEGCLETHKAR